jgi:hypothetical protein
MGLERQLERDDKRDEVLSRVQQASLKQCAEQMVAALQAMQMALQGGISYG